MYIWMLIWPKKKKEKVSGLFYLKKGEKNRKERGDQHAWGGNNQQKNYAKDT